jgi:pimeloyl-ACP methyl ester carboxylesterase
MAIKTIEYNLDKFEINYTLANPSKHKSIIFLHGWGSNKEIMLQAFKSTFKEYKHIYIDMPGFGKSPNSQILTTDDYTNIISIFLTQITSSKDIIVGHSFGGKVATILNPNILILLSSAGILVPKTLSTQIKIKLFKLLKNIGGTKLYSLFASKDVEGMSQNMYETFKNVVDEDFSPKFKTFSNKALLFWGKEDTATPLNTGEKIASIMSDATLFPLEGDHYFFLKNASIIENLTLKAING